MIFGADIVKCLLYNVVTSSYLKDIYHTVVYLTVRVIRDKPGYFALKMQKAMKGLGTDDQALVRIIISRSECDMVQIMNSFQQQFQGQLADWIRVGCHDKYSNILD